MLIAVPQLLKELGHGSVLVPNLPYLPLLPKTSAYGPMWAPQTLENQVPLETAKISF